MVNLIKGIIFDLDGVITDTAKVHALAWKKTFDYLLKLRASLNFSESYSPFNLDIDYPRYVDGKPREAGIVSFCKSRNIILDEGDTEDIIEKGTLRGVANYKDKYFIELLETKGVSVFSDFVEFFLRAEKIGLPMGVASSSKNCKLVLENVGLAKKFPVRVDGVVSKNMNLNGKPDPDIFLAAASLLGIPPHKTIIVEDAISGVQAGERGNFGVVVGLARNIDKEALIKNGADIAVETLYELDFDTLNSMLANKVSREMKEAI
ncbi:MAG: beta-phosphoglucomutase family hydrolase [Pseudomonadales bacterium]|nr:beta-phosphoglucomutase family hydrolase [Pseudomonadales bacterium]